MSGVNWWLMALAFVLGVVLTLALSIRRIKREVPVYDALGRGPDDATTGLPKVGATGAAAGAAGAGKPYGTGSIRIEPSATAPEGYPVKGNEDSMLYHTTESPSYAQTVAEIWFVDEESAIKGGFNRWDSGRSQRGNK